MRLVTAVLISLVSRTLVAQNYAISTFAGSATQVNIPGTSAILGAPGGAAADSAGNLFFSAGSVVLRLDAATGVLTLVAGNSTSGYSGDNGPAAAAQLSAPSGVAVDSVANIYIADTGNGCIRKVSNGIITTVAGIYLEDAPLGDNGPAIGAGLSAPSGVAVDSAGNIYIADTYNCRIRKVSKGVITTVAGSACGFAGDSGPATSARLNYPFGVAVDSTGNIYIADTFNNRIRKVSTTGIITTIAGNGTFAFGGDGGPATSAQLGEPNDVTVDSAGNLYIVDTFNNRIRKVSVSGTITTVAGNGTAGISGDNGPATSAQLDYPSAAALDSAGNIYIADYQSSLIRKISGNGTITTVAGNTKYGFSGDSAPATNAQFDPVVGINLDSAGNVYITDAENCRIRRVAGGIVTTVAGSGICGFGGDNGPATSALLNSPFGRNAVDSAGNLYIADSNNNRIRKVSNGVITTVAGTGRAGFAGDNGPAVSAQLSFPTSVALDSAGNLYITDQQNHRVREISNGIIVTVAGNGLVSGTGNNGPAVSAGLGYPTDIAVDSAGNLYIADGQVIYEVSKGIITTVAGPGVYGTEGDNGPATSAYLIDAAGVAVDSAGNLYIADSFENRIRKVSNGIITTIAGNGSSGFGGDGGPATGALLSFPRGVAVDANGNVYVGDTDNNRVRLLTPTSVGSCSYSVTPTSLQVPFAGGNFTVSIQTGAGCLWTVSGLPGFVTLSSPSSGSGPATITLVVAPNLFPPSISENINIAGISVDIMQAGNAAVLPTITAAGVTNAASFQTGIVPGGIITIFGTNLGESPGGIAFGYWQPQIFGTSVTINGATAPAYLLTYANGQEQLSVQAPWSVGATGSAAIIVTTINGSSPPVSVPVLAAQPGIFLLDAASSGATHLNGTVAGAAKPASRGEAVVLYLTGLGTVSNQPATGAAASLTTLSPTVVAATVTIGGVPAVVSFSGLAPGFIGLYQINTTIPQSAQSGLLDLTVSMNGTVGNTAKIAVQ